MVAAVMAISLYCFERTMLIDIQKNFTSFVKVLFVSENVKLEVWMWSDSLIYTGLFEMIVGVIHNTLEIAVYAFFYLIEQHSKFLLHTV